VTTRKCSPGGAVDLHHFCQTVAMRKYAKTKMWKLKLLWTEVLPVAEAVLRTIVMKEPCL